MITELSAFLATTAGKLVASAAVAAVSLGGAHATNLIDLPLDADQPAAAVVTAGDVPVDGTEAEGAVSDPAVDGSEAAADQVATDEAEGDRFGVEAEGEEAEGDRFGVEAEGEEAEGESVDADVGTGDTATEAADAAADDDADTDDDENDDANHGSIVSEFAHTTELEGCERGQAIAEIASSNATDHRQNGERNTNKCGAETETDDDTAADDTTTEADDVATEGDDDADTDDDVNHGSIVSEFAHTTELEGCERGQAIAEIASSNAADHRQNGERNTNKCGADTETDDDPAADESAVDTETEGVAAVDTSADADAAQTVTDVEATTGPGNSNNQGGGRPDHAGPPENAGRPDHAGGQGRGNK